MSPNRREFCITGTLAIVATACGSSSNPASPSSTTPLIDALRRDGYSVKEEPNEVGGVILRINDKLQQVKVGTTLVGIDESMGMDPKKSGPSKLNMARFEVPDDLGYVLLA